MRTFIFSTVFAFVVAVIIGWQSTALPGRADEGPDPPLAERPASFEQTQPRFAAGQIVVRFRDGAPERAIQSLKEAHGARTVKVQPFSGLHRLALPDGANLERVLTAFRNSPLVEEVGRSLIARALDAPDDTNYSYQWHLHNTNGGMWAEAAWDLSANKGQGVVVAVIDTGVAYEDFQHFSQAPDLAGTTFVAPKDFANNDAHANDDNGHGSHVTGTITQDTGNAYGVAGVADNSAIMPVKALDYGGSGFDDDLVEAIYYAVNNGARVISMSLAFPSTGSPDANGEVCTEIVGLNGALDFAYANGVVVVAAAGNDGADTVLCPAAYPTVIAVGATRFDGQVAPYSNAGSALDISAPGGDPNADQNGDGYSDGVLQETFCYDWATLYIYYVLFGINLYGEFCDVFYSGTSMATPHVAGTAALLLGEDPSLTPDQVRFYLESTARDRGVPGKDPVYGWGVLDAHAALAALLGAPTPTPTPTPSPTATPTSTPTPVPTSTPTPTPTATPTPTPTPTPAPSDTLHVGDLDGATKGKRNWSAKVTVYVHDADHDHVQGTTVTGHWSGDASGASSCVTDRKGKCSVQSPRLSSGDTSVTFTVDSISLSGYAYDADLNHDPDGDSNGTSITVTR